MSKAVKGKIFTVFGAKGGAGTSTIAVNLATGMAQLKGNPSVALVDMNLLSGDVPLFLNMKSVFNWVEVARNISRMDATYLMTVLQKHASEVHVLPAPMKMGKMQARIQTCFPRWNECSKSCGLFSISSSLMAAAAVAPAPRDTVRVFVE